MNRRAILLVEDESLIAMMEKGQLESHGYQVTAVASGEKAIGLLDGGLAIDLVLMDIDLGRGMDGTEAAEAMLRKHDLPILFLSSHTEKEIVERTERITNYGYVVKSSSITVLDASIKMAFKLYEANRTLQESNLRYESLAAQSRTYEWQVDAAGVFTYVSRPVEVVLGRRPAELVGRLAYYDLHPEEGRAAFKDAVKAIFDRKERILDLDNLVLSRDGSERWVSTNGYPVLDAAGNLLGYNGSDRDITERKLSEEAMRASEERYRLIDSSSREPIYSYDRHGRFAHVNNSLCRLLCLERDKIIGKTHRELGFPQEQCEEWDKLHAQVFDSDATVRAETATPIMDGEVRRFEVILNPMHDRSGAVVGISGTSRDITERVQAEERINRANEEWELTFNAVSDLICIIDTKYRIHKANSSMREKLGVDARQTEGSTCYQLVHGTEEPPEGCPHRQMLEDRREHSAEMREDRLGGDYHVTCSPLFNSDGRLLGSVHISRDISYRRRAEEEIKIEKDLYRTVLETVDEGFWRIDHQGRIRDVNEAYCRMSGYNRDELLSMSVPDIEVNETREETLGHIQRVLEKGHDRFETRHRCKDGHIIDLSISLSACHMGEKGTVGFMQKISGRGSC